MTTKHYDAAAAVYTEEFLRPARTNAQEVMDLCRSNLVEGFRMAEDIGYEKSDRGEGDWENLYTFPDGSHILNRDHRWDIPSKNLKWEYPS